MDTRARALRHARVVPRRPQAPLPPPYWGRRDDPVRSLGIRIHIGSTSQAIGRVIPSDVESMYLRVQSAPRVHTPTSPGRPLRPSVTRSARSSSFRRRPATVRLIPGPEPGVTATEVYILCRLFTSWYAGGSRRSGRRAMREWQATEARASWAQFVNAVESGEWQVISKYSRRVVAVRAQDLLELLAPCFAFRPEVLIEDEGYAIWLPELDVYGQGASLGGGRVRSPRLRPGVRGGMGGRSCSTRPTIATGPDGCAGAAGRRRRHALRGTPGSESETLCAT